ARGQDNFFASMPSSRVIPPHPPFFMHSFKTRRFGQNLKSDFIRIEIFRALETLRPFMVACH
ncbi:MAG TPA: hypothetical protein VN516_10590, partial [Candidatus Baltobacteraceae bacterium]|nr:hypothetical protein [Candidatus Baltobacteraceae bacterium]